MGGAVGKITGGLSNIEGMAGGLPLAKQGVGFIKKDILGGRQEEAALNAARAQEEAARRAGDVQMQMFQQTREDLSPYRTIGASGLSALQSGIMGGTIGNTGKTAAQLFRETPGYQEELSAGREAIEASAAARGGLLSGSTLKGLQQFGQDVASRNYQQFLGNLSNLAGMGQSSAGQTGQFAQYAGSQLGQAFQEAGAARASGYAGAAGARAAGIQNLIGIGGAAAGLSDRNAKENIKYIGKSNSGIPIVEFNYKGMKERYVGVIAQDLEKIVPDAVIEENGIKKVDYSKIDVDMRRI